MSKKILIACESEQVSDFIANYAAKEGFSVRVICGVDCEEQHIIRECCTEHPDIIILGGGCVQLEQACRHSSLDADIYLLKENAEGKNEIAVPIEMKRLDTIFSKYAEKKNNGCGELELDAAACMAKVGDREFYLTTDEVQMLRCFIANPNRVFSKEQLAFEVFGADAANGPELAELAVNELKTKLDGLSSVWSIRFLWGVGYKFEVNER